MIRILLIYFFTIYSFSLFGQNLQDSLIQTFVLRGQQIFTDINLQGEELKVSSFHKDQKSGITHVYFQQYLDDIIVYNALSSLHFDNTGKIVHSTNRLIDLKKSKTNKNQSISREEAIRIVANHFGFSINKSSVVLRKKGLNNMTQILRQTEFSNEPMLTDLIYVPQNDNVVLCWLVLFEKLDDKIWWNVKVDASSGQILDTQAETITCFWDSATPKNEYYQGLTHHAKKAGNEAKYQTNSSYHVFGVPLPSPNAGSRSYEIEPWVLALNASPYGWHDTNGIAGAEFTDTRGNNVYAQEDRDFNNMGGARPDGGPGLVFDFPLDLTKNPGTYTDAATTNLFYWNNMLHDIVYQYGFDEAAGNFQQNNYNRGGLGDDVVLADSQDGSGTNNANFLTPPEPDDLMRSPRMQMFEWEFKEVNLHVDSPMQIAGKYFTIGAGFGPKHSGPHMASLVLADENEACSPLTNGDAINGHIALMDRGNCEFDNKIGHAENAGALAAIVCNNNAGQGPLRMIRGSDGFPESIGIPSAMLSKENCDIIKNNMPAQITADWVIHPNFDSDLDNGIISHEYAHGISIRLTGGAASNTCLYNIEQMGEGWSDFFALIMTMSSGDTGSNGRGVGSYVSGQSLSGKGIRVNPYSTNMAINSLTYDHIKVLSRPHGLGTVWATMLWEMTWNLIYKYGFDSDLYNGLGGNNIALQLVITGMKLQPCSPGFVDGRNAILSADALLFGGANSCEIWRAFAKRGLGLSAVQGSTNSKLDGVEAYDLPEDCRYSPCTTESITYAQQTISNGTNEYANDFINLSEGVMIGSGSNVLLHARNHIEIQNEFVSFANSTFQLKIEPCDETVLSLEPPSDQSKISTVPVDLPSRPDLLKQIYFKR